MHVLVRSSALTLKTPSSEIEESTVPEWMVGEESRLRAAIRYGMPQTPPSVFID